MMATPKIEMKPTAAEMLKLRARQHRAQMPPIDSSTTLDSTANASSSERKARYKQDEDQSPATAE